MKKSQLDKIIREELQLVILENPVRFGRFLKKPLSKIQDLVKYRGISKGTVPYVKALVAIDKIQKPDLKRTSEILKSVLNQWSSLVPKDSIYLRGDYSRTMFPFKIDLDGNMINKVRFTGPGQVPEYIKNFPKGKYSKSDIEAIKNTIDNVIKR